MVDLRLHEGGGKYRTERLTVPRKQPAGTGFVAYDAAGNRSTLAGNLGSGGAGNPMRHNLVAEMRRHVTRPRREADA